jgi:hypothetical protein
LPVQDTLLMWLDTLTVDETAVRDLPCLLDIAVKIERQSAGVETSKAPVDVPIAPPLLPGDYARKLLSTPEGRDLAARQIRLLAACPVDVMDACSGVISFSTSY